MSRPTKQGVDYFPLDVYLDDKFKFIQIKYKLEGFAILIKLFQKVYSYGYWYMWTEDETLIFADENKADLELVNNVIEEAIKRDIFDKDLFDKYNILTSKGIQKRYKEIVRRRKDVEVKVEYLLIDNDLGVNDNIKPTLGIHDDSKSTQSKVDKNKDIAAYFEILWSLYPNKVGKGQIKDSKKSEVYKIGEEFKRCISRYIEYVEGQKNSSFKDLKYQNGSTFFNSGYVDYLDVNYIKSSTNSRVGIPPSESVLGERSKPW